MQADLTCVKVTKIMDRLSLHAEERKILGKKVKKLRADGLLPGHVFGKGVEGETVAVKAKDFLKTLQEAGETGLVDLKIGAEKVRPVLIREVQYDPVTGAPMHIDFYQVNLAEKVKVAVPIVQVGEEPESVHLGEAIVLQTMNEIEVEALPADLPEKIEVDITALKAIDDALNVAALKVDTSKITLQADPEEVVIKLAPAVSAETQELLEEQAAEQAAAAAEEGAEGAEAAAGEAGEQAEGEGAGESEEPAEGIKEGKTEEQEG